MYNKFFTHFTHIHTQTHTYTPTHTLTYTCTHTYTYTRTHTTYIYSHTHTYNIHSHAHTHIYNIHSHTHSHTHSLYPPLLRKAYQHLKRAYMLRTIGHIYTLTLTLFTFSHFRTLSFISLISLSHSHLHSPTFTLIHSSFRIAILYTTSIVNSTTHSHWCFFYLCILHHLLYNIISYRVCRHN